MVSLREALRDVDWNPFDETAGEVLDYSPELERQDEIGGGQNAFRRMLSCARTINSMYVRGQEITLETMIQYYNAKRAVYLGALKYCDMDNPLMKIWMGKSENAERMVHELGREVIYVPERTAFSDVFDKADSIVSSVR